MRLGISLLWLVHFLLAANILNAQVKTYQILPEHSSIGFSVIHMGFLEVEGGFEEFSGIIKLNFGKPENLEAEATIFVGSINTENTTRDKTIKSEGYLNSNTYPKIKYKSIDSQKSENGLELIGNLTIKDVKNQITFKYKVENISNIKVRITGEGIINREDFNLDFGPMDGFISDHVEIFLDIVAENETLRK